MVRAGALTRNEALKRVEVQGAVSKERISQAAEILELSPEEVTTILN
jgi:hypothetical protein